jgi:uncharacterized membrane protein
MAMITSWTKKQQPIISVILVALIAGFALLPAGSVAQPLTDQAPATVLDQLRSGACSPDSNSVHLCVEEFRSREGGLCCLRLSKDCLCTLQEKQAALNIQGPKLCGS